MAHRPFSPRPFAKPRFQCSPLLSQLFLLITGRSLRPQSTCQIRASSICQPSVVWMNFLSKFLRDRYDSYIIFLKVIFVSFFSSLILPSFCPKGEEMDSGIRMCYTLAEKYLPIYKEGSYGKTTGIFYQSE